MIRSVCDFLDNSALKFPNKIAFVEGQKSISYKDFNKITSAVASRILEFPIKKEPILIILPKGIDALISMFSVAKSGNFYSIIDEKMPSERVEKIIAKLRPKLIITSKELYFDYGIPAIFSDDFATFSINQTTLNTINIIDTDLLYVLFTSGSTGEPKGVAITHKSVVDFVFWLKETFNISENEILANQSPLYFDLSIFDIFGTIACSACIHLIQNQLFAFPAKIAQYLSKNKISMIFWVPSVLIYFANTNAFACADLSSLKKVLFCGEIMPTKQLNMWSKALPNITYANLYGPTEATDACSYYVINREFKDDEPLPIGKPCENTEFLVFDDEMRLITPDEIYHKGELYIRGTGLSVGYYNDPEKTAEAFIQNPLQNAYEEKIYKTGDIVAYNEYGELVCYGRIDSQIKLKGHRIELGEIETALNTHENIRRSACVFKDNEIITFYESNKELDCLKDFLGA
ncbi:amino acid adenylation domain-containing protein, partial [Campylobacter sp.]|uniref:amino acid adenylation domain-containing protein n=1 Tax=Campylobacter sp. TaxID=205 RepID=UPI002A749802